jgi:DNA polymerase-3 subunit gamma/tau
MDRLRFDAGLRARRALVLRAVLLVPLIAACAAQQVPPGPDPEYQRPEVVPWEGAIPEDPLANIEDEGEWVDDGPEKGAAPPSPAPQPHPAPPPEASPEPSTPPSPAPSSAPAPAPTPIPNPQPSPGANSGAAPGVTPQPSPAPKPPQKP